VTDLTPEALAAKVRHVMGSNASWDRIDVGLGEQALVELVRRAAALDAERARLANLEAVAEAARKLWERVEMDESVGICLSDRVPSLNLGQSLQRLDGQP